MKKRTVVLVTALIFLFGQIGILELGNLYFGFDISSAGVVILIWASAILCGYYSHWAVVYLKKGCR